MRLATCSLLLMASAALAAPSKPEATARQVLDGQFATLREPDAARRVAYDKSAVLLGSDSHHTVAEIPDGYADLIVMMGSSQVDRVKIDSLVGGGDPNVVWYTATVTASVSGAAEGVGTVRGKVKSRITQVAVPVGAEWKVVASIIDDGDRIDPNPSPPEALGGATATGPLAALLASPKALAAALSTDPHTFVIGSGKDERAIGPAAAKKLLASWAKLSLSIEGKVREVATTTYAFAQANLKWTKGKDTYWMEAMLVAVPAPDGAWKVVGVHYANIH